MIEHSSNSNAFDLEIVRSDWYARRPLRMRTLIDIWLFLVAPAAFVLVGVTHYHTHSILLRQLRSRHEALWRKLGKPNILEALLTAGSAWSVWSSGKPSYVRWLWCRGYRDLRDPRTEYLGNRLRLQTGLGLSIFLAWSAVAWLGGYGHIR